MCFGNKLFKSEIQTESLRQTYCCKEMVQLLLIRTELDSTAGRDGFINYILIGCSLEKGGGRVQRDVYMIN